MSVSVGVDCHEVKTIPANNTSSVYLKIWVTTSGDSYNEYTRYGSIWFNGEKVDVEYTLPKNTSTVVYEGTKKYHMIIMEMEVVVGDILCLQLHQAAQKKMKAVYL